MALIFSFKSWQVQIIRSQIELGAIETVGLDSMNPFGIVPP